MAGSVVSVGGSTLLLADAPGLSLVDLQWDWKILTPAKKNPAQSSESRAGLFNKGGRQPQSVLLVNPGLRRGHAIDLSSEGSCQSPSAMAVHVVQRVSHTARLKDHKKFKN